MNIRFLPLHLFFLVPPGLASEYPLVHNKNMWKIYWGDHPAYELPSTLIYVIPSFVVVMDLPSWTQEGHVTQVDQ